ncbi:MAG TPA: 5'-3' exonuclease H3TH domain-containing protein [Nitriliruptorales bacterium]
MRVHLVDGTYELFRAHFTPRPGREDPQGRDVKATEGLVNTLLYLLHDQAEQTTHVAVAFDNPIESFRNDLFPGYKSSAGVDESLLAQFDRAEAATRALGVAVWSMDRYEADDALAAGAARFRDDAEVRIMTIDKDLAQCVVGDRVVQVDRRNEVVYDADGVRSKHGVAPASIPDYLALVGDSADGFPGIKGFGKKTAATILARYGRLEDIPADGDTWEVTVRGAGSLAQRLQDEWAQAVLYRELATLVTDIDVGTLEDIAWQGVPREEFLELCDDLGVTGIADRDWRWA